MRIVLALGLLSAPLLLSDAAPSWGPDIAGAWKADLQKSKFEGKPPTDYVELIQYKTVVTNRRTNETAQETDELSGVTTDRGEERELLAFIPNGRPRITSYTGVPNRIAASWQEHLLTLTAEVAGRPQVTKRIYTLSPDGQTLTIQIDSTDGTREHHSTIFLTKQPDVAADSLRKPEELAETHFKNVKAASMKVLPASQFIDQMRYISWSLDRNCEFCHVRGHFDSDDKKEKKTAREMIDMVASIDHQNFKDHPDVRCLTCHEGYNRPLNHPLFPEEAAAMKEAREREMAQQQQGGGPGARPNGPPPSTAPAPAPPPPPQH